ncbi:MAG: outer membrane protein assembly factor BamB [Gammaproteobacteria bacterium]|nr:outer membrane protein assembly factor BamB [Gammaproteobacteria bacterium]
MPTEQAGACRWPRILTTALALASLAGCGMGQKVADLVSSNDDAVQPAELVEFAPAFEVVRAWTGSVGKGSDDHYLKLTPALVDGIVYAADRGGRVRAVELEDGRELWEIKLKKMLISGAPGASAEIVVVGGSEAEVVALSSSDGSELWRTTVSSEVLAPPQVSGNIVLVRSGDGKLHALNAQTGGRLWIYDRTVPILTLRGSSAPVVVRDLVVAGFDSGRLAALELNSGKALWETRIAIPSGRSDLERMVDIDSTPVVLRDTVYVASFQGQVAAVTLATGQIQWTREISSYAGLAVDNTAVYVADADSHIWALDRLTGASLWKQEALYARRITAPAVFRDYVIVGDFEGYLHWMSPVDGSFQARSRASNKELLIPPLAAGDTLLSFSANGKMAAFRLP